MQTVKITVLYMCIIIFYILRFHLVSFTTMTDSNDGSIVSNYVVPFLLRSGTVIVGLVAVVAGILYVKQDSLLYFPGMCNPYRSCSSRTSLPTHASDFCDFRLLFAFM